MTDHSVNVILAAEQPVIGKKVSQYGIIVLPIGVSRRIGFIFMKSHGIGWSKPVLGTQSKTSGNLIPQRKITESYFRIGITENLVSFYIIFYNKSKRKRIRHSAGIHPSVWIDTAAPAAVGILYRNVGCLTQCS